MTAEDTRGSENVMIRIGGRVFYCDAIDMGHRACGCNVFQAHPSRPGRYVCNSCDAVYVGRGDEP